MSENGSVRIKDKEVARILGIGRSTLWAWVKTRPGFPQPRRDGGRCTFWIRAEVEAYAVRNPASAEG